MGGPVDVRTRFGKRVRQLRQERGYSQEAFAQHAQLDRTYMGGVERGARNVSLINIERIARALGVAIRDLF